MDLRQRLHQVRLLLVLALCVVGLAALGVRLYQLQVTDADGRGKSRQDRGRIRLNPERGCIYDRNQVPLALNCERPSLRLKGCEWKTSSSAVRHLAKALGMQPDRLQRRIDLVRGRIKRSGGSLQSDIICYNVDVEQQAAVEALDLPGLFFADGTGRVYPGGALAGSTLGFVGLGGKGREGVELYADDYLQGSVGILPTLRDGRGTNLLLTDVTKLRSTRGADVVLALDSYIQFLAEKELERISEKYHPRWASIVVMEPDRGEERS